MERRITYLFSSGGLTAYFLPGCVDSPSSTQGLSILLTGWVGECMDFCIDPWICSKARRQPSVRDKHETSGENWPM